MSESGYVIPEDGTPEDGDAPFQERRHEGIGYYLRGTRETTTAGKIHENPWNPNRMTDLQRAALQGSIRKHGFMQEVLVRPHPTIKGEYQIIDGEQRTTGIRFLSEENPDAPVDIRIIDAPDVEAKKITIMANRDRGSHDPILEAVLVKEIKEELGEGWLEGLPWTETEADEIVSMADADWSQYGSAWDDEERQGGGDSGVTWVEISVTLTEEDHQTLQDAGVKVREESGDLSKVRAVAYGQIIAALAQEFLGSRDGE